MKKNIGLSLLLILLIAASSGFAQAKSWELDKAHANIYFGVDHIFTKSRGHFDNFSGKYSGCSFLVENFRDTTRHVCYNNKHECNMSKTRSPIFS